MAQFHFADPWWLLGLLLPLIIWMLPVTRLRVDDQERLSRYADHHLLPHLLLQGRPQGENRRRRFLIWSAIWSLGIIAMAGPRWDFTEVKIFKPGSSLVVLLDLSASMNVADVQPTRLVRARQEIADLLDQNRGVRIGLIAFASVAHVVSPISDDAETLRHMLPYLSTELTQMTGSRLSAALERAKHLLAGQPEGSTHAIVLISDGDFEDPDLEAQVEELYQQGIRFHVLAMGTDSGGPVPKREGGWLQDSQGRQVISKLDEQGLRQLADVGDGIYRQADYREGDTRALLERLLQDAPPEAVEMGAQRIWNEYGRWLIIPMLLLMLSWFRRCRAAARLAQ